MESSAENDLQSDVAPKTGNIHAARDHRRTLVIAGGTIAGRRCTGSASKIVTRSLLSVRVALFVVLQCGGRGNRWSIFKKQCNSDPVATAAGVSWWLTALSRWPHCCFMKYYAFARARVLSKHANSFFSIGNLLDSTGQSRVVAVHHG